MDYKTYEAKTVQDAITMATIDLGTVSTELEVEVVSEGSKGFLGLRPKNAVIKVRKKGDKFEEPLKEKAAVKEQKKANKKEEKTVKEEKKSVNKEEKKAVNKEENKAAKETKKAAKEEKKQAKEEKEEHNAAAVEETGKKKGQNRGSKNHNERKEDRREREHVSEKSEEEIAQIKESADTFLKQVFAAMELPVEIHMEYIQGEGALNIDFAGDDMGVLIGKRGQTLDSLQYLTSLVVNKDRKEYIRVKIDTEDYRSRRKETLENLAKNIAAKVKKTRRTVVLEPMNPYERRIIHSTLQSNKYVETYSEGNEPYRHVIVVLKKQGSGQKHN